MSTSSWLAACPLLAPTASSRSAQRKQRKEKARIFASKSMSSDKRSKSPAVVVASERRDGSENNVVTLAYGVTARLIPVPAAMIDEVTSRVKDPPIPMWHNPEKERDEPNPSDPEYARALSEAARQRGIAAIDAMVMFGVEVVGELPPDDQWLSRLQFMEKRGLLDLSGYNLEDPMDKEFLFKRLVAVDNTVLMRVSELSGITAEGVERAESSFQRSKAR